MACATGKGERGQWPIGLYPKSYIITIRIYSDCLFDGLAARTCRRPPDACKGARVTSASMPGLRHVHMAISPIVRPSTVLSHTSILSPYHSLRTLRSSLVCPPITPPRLYGQLFASLYHSVWPRAKEHGSDTNRHQAGSLAVLRPVGSTNVAVGGHVRQQLIEHFIARVDKLDPAPAKKSPQQWLCIPQKAEPFRCILLVLPDEPSREAACKALQKVCERWDGWVGALRNSYVCPVVLRETLDTLRNDLERDRELNFIGEVRIYCAVGSRYEMDAIPASSQFTTYIEASAHEKGEARRILLCSKANPEGGVFVDHNTVDTPATSKENTSASLDTENFNLDLECLASVLKRTACLAAPVVGTACLTYYITKAMSRRDEQQGGGGNRAQEQHRGESRNYGKSEQRSDSKFRQGNIHAGGDVYNSTHIYHGCDANPLSSSSPTVGNNQPNGNEGLSQKQ